VRFWVGVTDNRWFDFISSREFDEVNFWQPSARAPFSTLPAGTPFLFKLKAPHNCIAGGGGFVRFTQLPLSLAWDAFGERNGARSIEDLQRLIQSNSFGPLTFNPDIGCTVVTEVFYLPPDRRIPLDSLFATNIVRGRTYDTASDAGQLIWSAVEDARSTLGVAETVDVEERNRFGRPFLMRARLGQGSFRTGVIDAYRRRCAITGETTLPVLEAAHIKPFAEEGPHRIDNGLLLRSDFHKLFDTGLVTIEPDYTIRISSRIRDRYFNGKAYYRLNGRKLESIPDDPSDCPRTDYLRWHNERRFME
jgi:HNH endonuclease